MRAAVLSVVSALVAVAFCGTATGQELSWQKPYSEGTAKFIHEIIDTASLDEIERVARGLPSARRDVTRREILNRLLYVSFDREFWDSRNLLNVQIKLAQAASFLTSMEEGSRLQSLTNAELAEARQLRSLLGYPSGHDGSLLLWARRLDMLAVPPALGDAEYAVAVVRKDGQVAGELKVLEWLKGGEYLGIGEVPTDVPLELLERSGLSLSHTRIGSSSRITLRQFYVALAMGKLAVLLNAFPSDERFLMELVIVNGLEASAWLGAPWAAVGYRSRLSSLLHRLEQSESVFTAEDMTYLNHRLVAGAFFARAFGSAADHYLATAEAADATSFDKLYGYFGAGMSYLGGGDQRAGWQHLLKAVMHLRRDVDHRHAYMLLSMFQSGRGDFSSDSGGAPDSVIEEKLLQAGGWISALPLTREGREFYETMNEDFYRMMHTIMRPDISIRHAMAQVRFLDEGWPEEDGVRLRAYFINQIHASLTDLFYKISFQWTDGAWARRAGQREAFLPTLNQLKFPARYDEPYSMAHPEEDRAVVIEHAELSLNVWKCEHADDAIACITAYALDVPGFVRIDEWVDMNRHAHPQPSRAFLKAAWAYWFGLVLEGKTRGREAGFAYYPLDVFPDVSLRQAEALLESDVGRAEADQERSILRLMIRTRLFLEDRFRPRSDRQE